VDSKRGEASSHYDHATTDARDIAGGIAPDQPASARRW
jgi:hypothetical protein